MESLSTCMHVAAAAGYTRAGINNVLKIVLETIKKGDTRKNDVP